MTIQLSIDREHPFDSLVQFTKNHRFLNDASIHAYFQDLKTVFGELAYQQEKRPVPIEIQGRLQKVDLPHLFSRLGKDLFWNKKYEFAKLMAAISQVANLKLKSIGGLGTYTIEVKNPQNPEKPLYRGWIYRSYAHASESLMQCVNENGIIQLEAFSPQALWTLQRFQEANFVNSLTRECKIPENAAQELTEFFKKYGLNDLRDAFKNWMSLSVKTGLKEDTSPFDKENPFRSLKRFVQGNSFLNDCTQSFMNDFSRFFTQAVIDNRHIPLSERYQKRFVTIDLPFLLTISPIPYVTDEERLIAAIQMVAQLQFSSLAIVENDFGEGMDIRFVKPPKVELTTIAPIPLAKLVTQSPKDDYHLQNIALDSHGLIQLLFTAAALNLPALRRIAVEGIIQGLKNDKAEMTRSLCAHFDRQEIQDVLKERNILLVAPKETDHPNFHVRLFLLNLQIASEPHLKDILRFTFANQTISKSFLKFLWDEVDDRRKKEILDLFVHDIYSSLKPDLNLEELQHFCGHLALGIVSFVRSSALNLYRFLTKPAVKESFTHPEVLQKILETFPTVYPELMPNVELDTWREQGALPFQDFFNALKAMRKSDPTANAMELEDHLHKCFKDINAIEEMEAGIAEIFYKMHHFQNQAEKMRRFASIIEKAESLFQKYAPNYLKRTFLFLLQELKDYLQLTSKQMQFEEWMKPFPIEEPEPVNLLMNMVWRMMRTSSHPAYLFVDTGWEKPIPTHLQVEWLYILSELKDKIHLEPITAAQFLAKHRVNREPTENPHFTLALCQLKKMMLERNLSSKAIDIFIQFRTSAPQDDSSLTAGLEIAETHLLIQFLHETETLKLMEPFPELVAFRQRLLNIMEPSMLPTSLLSLSQFFTWKS